MIFQFLRHSVAMNNNIVNDCPLVHLPKIHNRAGNITVLENNINIPFEIKRIYYLYDMPGGESRGGHAHKGLHQLIVAVSGSFDVKIDDGKTTRIIHLNRSYFGLYIIPGIWRELLNFSSGAICLVLASAFYNENDYVRDYKSFLKWKSMK